MIIPSDEYFIEVGKNFIEHREWVESDIKRNSGGRFSKSANSGSKKPVDLSKPFKVNDARLLLMTDEDMNKVNLIAQEIYMNTTGKDEVLFNKPRSEWTKADVAKIDKILAERWSAAYKALAKINFKKKMADPNFRNLIV